jgi:hypothetical protein
MYCLKQNFINRYTVTGFRYSKKFLRGENEKKITIRILRNSITVFQEKNPILCETFNFNGLQQKNPRKKNAKPYLTSA